MAETEQLKALLEGVSAWNKWKQKHPHTKPDLIEAELSGANLTGANLSQADLIGANLSRANLSRAHLSAANLTNANLSGANLTEAYLLFADLTGANLNEADLSRANITGADLTGADLSKANLIGSMLASTNLSRANLKGTDFAKAALVLTTFAGGGLSEARGLESVGHYGPSSIGIDTFFLSGGKIPEVFLKGAGVPEEFIHYAASLAGKSIEFNSAFISYASRDEDLAKRLYADLQAKGVRCWRFAEDAKWGEPVWGEIDFGIKAHDKVVVICSEQSLQSGPVLREIERALQREDREKKSILFPLRIDDYIFVKWEHERKADVVKKVVGDMLNWKDHDSYQKAFDRLLRDLRAKP